MALVLKDRVKETTSTAGIGTVSLDGAVAGFQGFSAVGNGNSTYYAIVDPATGDWEVGVGTYTSSGSTLSRSTVLSSSNSGALVSFAANPKDVFVTYPSEKGVWLDASGVATATSFGAITATSVALTTGTISTTPTSGTDIANKTYVDTIAAESLHYHEPVFVESPNTAGNLNALYNQPGGAGVGVGATLTNNGTKAALTIDGVLMTVGKRVLIYNQTSAFQNGIYTVTTVGTPDPGGTNWVLTRATDADTYAPSSPNSLGKGDAFFVTSGNTGAGETYVCNTVGAITFGSTNITFAQISDSTLYTAGTGLNLSSGTTFNISNTGVSANTYGSASAVPVFAVNAQGQITSVTDTPIAINGSAVSGNITGSAGSVANALTLGTYLTGTSYNGSTAVTATVDATSANTASKVVARDVSGNFSAGTITANLSGNATTATTATNLAGGAANQIAYQASVGSTSFAAAPTASGELLNWNGSAYAWTLTPTITSVTLSGGTANGVTYLNGSKVLTSGSALTFDGTNLGVGTSSPSAKLEVVGGVSAQQVQGRYFGFGTAGFSLDGTTVNDYGITYTSISTTFNTVLAGFSNIKFATSQTERMRIDSSGNVGIGTSSPGARLEVVTNNTNAALRITQLGAGNALLVEDSTNPDATPFVIDSNGNAIIGTTTTQSLLNPANNLPSTNVFQVNGTSYPSSSASVLRSSETSLGAYLILASSRGSLAAKTASTVNDTAGTVSFQGYDGTNFLQPASIAAFVDGTPGTNDMPGRLVFSTTADGASAPTEHMRLNSSGNVGIGTSSPGARLDVRGASGAAQASIGTNANILAFNGYDNDSFYATLASTNSTAFGIGTQQAIPLFFLTGNTERARIDSSGNLYTANGKIGPNATQQHTMPAVASDTYTLNAATQTLTNKTVSGLTLNDGYTEEVFAVTGTTPALSPTNGSIQTWTLSGNSTPTAGTWAAGQSIVLMVDDGTAYTVTWTSLAVTWITGGATAPILATTGYTVITLWKVGTTIYGVAVGG